MHGNKAPFRRALVDAIKEEGCHVHAQRVLDEVRLRLRQRHQNLLEILRQRENGVKGFDSETTNRMRAAEVARGRSA